MIACLWAKLSEFTQNICKPEKRNLVTGSQRIERRRSTDAKEQILYIVVVFTSGDFNNAIAIFQYVTRQSVWQP